jgi:tyrosine-protein kinase Tec
MIVTEFMKYGALVQYLKRNKTVLVKDLDKLLDMCFQICCGMQYLEQHNVIHRDLAARNCLVGNKQVVKICDFGLARHVLDDEYSSSVGAKFPVRWSSPEVMAYTKFSSKSDVWAFAVLMWEVYAFGKLPYEELKNIDVVELVCHQNFRLEKPQPCPENVFNLMSSCWEKEPEDRPTFSSLHEQLKFLTEN